MLHLKHDLLPQGSTLTELFVVIDPRRHTMRHETPCKIKAELKAAHLSQETGGLPVEIFQITRYATVTHEIHDQCAIQFHQHKDLE